MGGRVCIEQTPTDQVHIGFNKLVKQGEGSWVVDSRRCPWCVQEKLVSIH